MMSAQVMNPAIRAPEIHNPVFRSAPGKIVPAGLTAAALLELYERMVLLRRFESVAQTACRKGETPGFLHLYIGEEATAVGVCAHLRPTDWITSTHRGHGHALAKGMDPNILMAELFGKRDGCCGGRGGTMHLYDRKTGLFGTNGIVAAGISHAVGAGLSARNQGKDGVGVAFFGDGATNHGGFHESLNFAGIQKAPAVSRLRKQPLRHGDAARLRDAEPGDRHPRGGLWHSRRRRRRQ
jgi:2-oxoisovalerate dehydrogenase E1 component